MCHGFNSLLRSSTVLLIASGCVPQVTVSGDNTGGSTVTANASGGQSSAGGRANTGGSAVSLTSSTGASPSAGGSSSTGGTVGVGGSPQTGGAAPTGGTNGIGGTSSIGTVATGGAIATGGVVSTVGGATPTGGSRATNTATATGGITATGGAAPSGGTNGIGGTTAVGTITAGGAIATGGAFSTGGAISTGGQVATGGSANTGGVPVVITASNSSTTTGCAEQDNVDILLTSGATVTSFTIEATQPTYVVGTDSCDPNFSQCPAASDPSYAFAAATSKLFDDGETVVTAVREATWWRPQGMKASIDSTQQFVDAHYITVSKNIPGTNEYPQFFVLYQDSNLRVIPFPPAGTTRVCFGSSILVGPVSTESRPYAEIASVNYVTVSKTLHVTYVSGGSSEFDLSTVSRTSAQIRVSANYTIASQPFVAFRSMFVTDGNADVDHVRWTTQSSTNQESAILSFAGGASLDWFFYRATRSVHNTSAPDIRITVTH